MSETFKAAREGFRRLKKSLSEANEDTRIDFVWWCIGLCLMGSAIVIEFRWSGLMFCAGAVVYFASGPKK